MTRPGGASGSVAGDVQLASVMAEHGLAVEEEAVAETLANDLVTGQHSH